MPSRSRSTLRDCGRSWSDLCRCRSPAATRLLAPHRFRDRCAPTFSPARAFENGGGRRLLSGSAVTNTHGPGVKKGSIPEATVARLPIYLRALVDIAEGGATTISSEALAEAAGVNSAKVRKDLSHLGSYGTRGVGYDVAYLIHQIRRELGLTQPWPIAIAGIGNLGHALANYKGFSERGFQTVALVDRDPAKVGEMVGGLTIQHIDELPEIVAEHQVSIGVVCTPAAAVQEVADRMIDAGIRSILNFAPIVVNVPAGVSLRKVDLAIELQILAYYEQRKATIAEVKRRGKAVADVTGP
ncbi:MAG: redox-sensing transcriptional repressor Rex [Actinomycetota bacterium]